MIFNTLQFAFENEFKDIRFDEAISILLGDLPLTDAQSDLLRMAAAEKFTPQPVGHLGFHLCVTKSFTEDDKIILVPGTQLARSRLNRLRKSELAALLSVDQEAANFLFKEVTGWQPAIDFMLELFKVIERDPEISDHELKVNHGVHFWKNSQKRAIRALRRYFRSEKLEVG